MANIHNNRHSPVSDVFENGAITTVIGVMSRIFSFIGTFRKQKIAESNGVPRNRPAGEGHVTLTG